MALFIFSFIIWALLHSLLAANFTKTAVRRWIGDRAYEGLYRLFYNLVSFITILPVLAMLAFYMPDKLLWKAPPPFNSFFLLIQLVGLAGLTVALWQTDLWDFIGLRQFVGYITRNPNLVPEPFLVTTGMYALVRHPLYFFTLFILWFNPVMMLSGFIFNLVATTYLWAGSRVEERRLAADFGEYYASYRQQTPHLIPTIGSIKRSFENMNR